MTASAPHGYEQLLETILSSLEEGDVVTARRHLVRARTDLHDDDRMRGALVALELVCIATTSRRGDDELLADLESRAATQPREFANTVGRALFDAGEWLGTQRWVHLADRWFRHHVVGSMRDAVTFANHGAILERLERFEHAVEVYTTAANLDPQLDDVVLRLARAASMAGYRGQATDAYRRYLSTHPDDASAWISLGLELSNLRRIADAEQAYWRAAGLEPENLSLHFNWMITARQVGDPERAQRAASKLKVLAPADWRTRVAESYLVLDTGDVAGAFRMFRELFRELMAAPTCDRSIQKYVANEVARLLLQSGDKLAAETDSFIGEVFAAELFTVPTLELVRTVERAEENGLFDHFVIVEALYGDAENPFACLVSFDVHAPDPAEAAALAQRFERRCGATDTRIHPDDLVQRGPLDRPGPPGVRWRSSRTTFPLAQFGIDE